MYNRGMLSLIPENFNKSKFWSRADLSNPEKCWIWTHKKDTYKYGRFRIKRGGKTYEYSAHRLSYILCNPGKDISNLCILHKCDNPSCINPRHLLAGTQLENVKDRQKKNRYARGSRMGTSKLLESQVLEIFKKFDSGESPYRIAKDYGVSIRTARKIRDGELWKELRASYETGENLYKF